MDPERKYIKCWLFHLFAVHACIVMIALMTCEALDAQPIKCNGMSIVCGTEISSSNINYLPLSNVTGII